MSCSEMYTVEIAIKIIWCRHGQQQLDMDKSGNSNNSKESGPSAAFNSSNIWLAAPKTFVWAREKLDGCERDRCCKVMLDADVYFRTAHEYFKAFTKCWEEKKDSDAKLAQQKVLWSELVEKVCMLQAAFSQVAQEKEALRAENVLLVPDNVELRSRLHEQQSQLHEQQALGVRLQEKVHELEDDVQGLQEQFGELQVRCDGLEEELKVKDMENNKLRTSLEQGALDAPKIEEKPKAVPDVIKKGPPLALAAKRQSVDSDDEITFVACVKRVKESEPTTTTAPCAAAVVASDQQKPAVPPAMAKDQQKPAVPPVVVKDQQKPSVPPVVANQQKAITSHAHLVSFRFASVQNSVTTLRRVFSNSNAGLVFVVWQAPENANGSFSQSNILVEEFWYIMKEREQALLSGSTTARALVDQFMLTWPACIELEQHQQAAIRHDLVQFAESIFDFIRQNNALPPLKIKNHQFLVNNEHTVPSRN
ncbi:hypothetical protein GPALN_011746 [Globodera pallida]|nr:hypothetical protein GPALN_011746 [Globodera pallida]